jgi:hypothetical protein
MWVVLLGGAAYLAYEYLLAPNASAATVVAAAAPAATGTPTSNPAPSAIVTPPLGTPITSNSQAAMQVSANYPYIIPLTSASAQQPGGYIMAADSNPSEAPTGQVWVRTDVANALLAWINANNANGPASIGTLFTFPVSLAQIQSVMSSNGLHGLGLAGLYTLYQQMGWN